MAEEEIITTTEELLERAEAKKGKFDLDADPFDTGFEFNTGLTTDNVIAYLNDKDRFLGIDPKNPPEVEPKHFPPELWKAHCKAAIKNGWFSAPADWRIDSVGKWELAQTFWLYNWIRLKYVEMIRIPFS
jgi:hypothetical protein